MFSSLFKSHPVFFAILLMAITLLPVMCLRDVSPSNELRYLSIVDEAIQNGDVFTFSNHGIDYADKPPLYFWLLMLCRLIFGTHCIPVLSMFSFIPAMVIIAVMDKWLRTTVSMTSLKVSAGERFASALMTGTCVLFLGGSIVLRMDMLMCMFITLALFTFYKMYKGVGNIVAQRFLLPFYIFMALFSKGPVGLLMPIVCIFFFLLLMGKIREAGKYLGWRTWLVLILFSGIWFLGVWLEGGTEYLNNLLFHQTLDRAVDAAYHKEPFWFYLPALLYSVAPYSLLLILYIVLSFIPRGFVTDSERLLSISVAVTFIMLSCFSSKLSIYLLPIFPLLTYLSVFVNKRNSWNFGQALSLWIPAVILLLAGIALAFLQLLIAKADSISAGSAFADSLSGALRDLASYDFLSSPFVYVAAGVIILCSIFAMISLVRKSWTGAVSWIALSLLLTVASASPVVPQINDYIGYRNLCEAAAQVKAEENLSGYSTLKINRPENMDVWLGENLVSSWDETEAFLASISSDEDSAGPDRHFAGQDLNSAGPDHSGEVLMVRLSALEESPELAKALAGRLRAEVGDYGVFSLKTYTGSSPEKTGEPAVQGVVNW